MNWFVQHDTVATIRQDEKRKLCKRMINFSYPHTEFFVSENRNCDVNCILQRRGTVPSETRQIRVLLLQK